MIKVKMYKAKEGDAFLVSLVSDLGNKNILIDMGLSSTYRNEIKKDLLILSSRGECIDLLIVTHVDKDHIEGVLEFIKENGRDHSIIKVNEIWHNSFKHLQFDKVENISDSEVKFLKSIISENIPPSSDGKQNISANHGSSLAALLLEFDYPWNISSAKKAIEINNKQNYVFDGFNIFLLSPDQDKLKKLSDFWERYLNSKRFNFKISDDIVFNDAFEFFMMNQSLSSVDNDGKKNISATRTFDLESLSKVDVERKKIDSSPTNGSSIAFILEFGNRRMLFLGDSHDDIIIREIKKRNSSGEYFDLIKTSHHGSNNNFRTELCNIITSDKYLISTDGVKYNHPNIEVIAKIASKPKYKNIYFNYDHSTFFSVRNESINNGFDYDLSVSNEIIIE
jgi:beta-lactamase superfamily II metal-dependent hydrolase